MSAADLATALEARSLHSPELHDFLIVNRVPPPESWPLPIWDRESLILAAFHYHPDLALARAEWAAARAGIVTAGQHPAPSLDLAPQFNTTTPRSLVSPWVLPINFVVGIETAGKRGARRRRADQLSRSSWWEIATAAWHVRQGVQTSLLGLQETREEAALLEERAVVLRELTESLERRYAEGDVGLWDLALSRIAAQSLQLDALDARRREAQAEVLLAAALGLPVSALDGVELRFAPLHEPPPDVPVRVARRQALLNRTDVLSALADYEAAEETLKLEIARQYPDIRLGPGYEFDQGDNKWTLGVSIALPSFNSNRGPIQEATAQRATAAARFEARQSRVLGEIDLALAGLSTQAEQADAAAAILAGSLEQEARARVRRQAGALSGYEVLLAHAETLRARQELLRVLAAHRRAYFDLETALQSPAQLPASFFDETASAVSAGREVPEP